MEGVHQQQSALRPLLLLLLLRLPLRLLLLQLTEEDRVALGHHHNHQLTHQHNHQHCSSLRRLTGTGCVAQIVQLRRETVVQRAVSSLHRIPHCCLHLVSDRHRHHHQHYHRHHQLPLLCRPALCLCRQCSLLLVQSVVWCSLLLPLLLLPLLLRLLLQHRLLPPLLLRRYSTSLHRCLLQTIF